jgi:hypothetical protein
MKIIELRFLVSFVRKRHTLRPSGGWKLHPARKRYDRPHSLSQQEDPGCKYVQLWRKWLFSSRFGRMTSFPAYSLYGIRCGPGSIGDSEMII